MRKEGTIRVEEGWPKGVSWAGRLAAWASSAPPGAPEERKVQGMYQGIKMMVA